MSYFFNQSGIVYIPTSVSCVYNGILNVIIFQCVSVTLFLGVIMKDIHCMCQFNFHFMSAILSWGQLHSFHRFVIQMRLTLQVLYVQYNKWFKLFYLRQVTNTVRRIRILSQIQKSMQGIRIQSCTNLHEGRLRKTKYSQQSLLYRNIKISFHFQKKLTSEEKDVIFIHLSITL